MKFAFISLLAAVLLVASVYSDLPGGGSVAGSGGGTGRRPSSSGGGNRGSSGNGNNGGRYPSSSSSSGNNNNQDNAADDNNNNNNDHDNSESNNNNDDFNTNDNDNNEYESSGSNNEYHNNNNNKHSSSSSSKKSNKHSSSSNSGSANLASVIPEPQQVSQSLNEVYGANTETLLNLKFGPQFYQWNPRHANSTFHWGEVSGTDLPSDNAVIQLVNGNGEAATGAYAKPNNNAYENNADSYAKILSLPFSSEAYEEGYMHSNANYTVTNTQRIFFRMLSSCQTVGTEDHPFPSYLVTYPQDDPRLANCNWGISNAYDDVSRRLAFEFEVTNQGVWAIYLTNSFISKRRVGSRERYDSLVDAGIEYDGRTNTATYYLNGYKVWTINAVGTVPPSDGYTHTDAGDTSVTTATQINTFQVCFGTLKCLDESNPWNASDSTLLVRIRAADSRRYTGLPIYDADKTRRNLVWGQGATMSLYKLKVWRARSVAPKPTILPGVYGARAPVNQNNNNNNHNNNDYQNNNNNDNNNNNNDYDQSSGNSDVFNF